MSIATDNLSRALTRAQSVRPAVGGFPYLAEALRQAGISRCRVDVPANSFLYAGEAGPVVVQGEPLVAGPADVAPFDELALVRALRADQAGESTLPEFMTACWAAGVTTYEVDTAARICTYRGSLDDVYVERYADVQLGRDSFSEPVVAAIAVPGLTHSV
jgi:uncharacterized protein YbcV (DUF1398 family)